MVDRRFAPLIVVVVALVAVAGCSSNAPPGTSAGATPGGSVRSSASVMGTAFVEALSKGEFTAASEMADAAMQAATPISALQSTWNDLLAQYGPVRSIGQATTSQQASSTLVSVPVHFARATVTLGITVIATGQVGAIHVGTVEAAPSG
jgi:hypothetical protein